MAKGIGRLTGFGIARETTRGTSPGSATFWLPFMEAGLEEKFENALDESTIGVIEDSVGATRVKEWAEGNVKALITDRTLPLILYSILGSLSTAAGSPEAGTNTHTITVGQSAQHQSLSFYIDDPLGGQDYTHALGVVQSLEIVYEAGKPLEFSATLKSKKGATASFASSSNTENRFTHKHFTFKLATNLAGLGGASAQNIRTLSLKISQNIEDDPALGSLAPVDFLNKQFTIEGTLEAIWQNESDFKTFVLAGTQKAMRLDLKNTDVIIGTVTNPQLTIDLAKVIFKEITKPFKANDVIKQMLSFKAHYSTADSKMITISAVNTTASY